MLFLVIVGEIGILFLLYNLIIKQIDDKIDMNFKNVKRGI